MQLTARPGFFGAKNAFMPGILINFNGGIPMVTKIVNNDTAAVFAEDIALIDFSATWCGPCTMVAPVVESLSEKFAGRIAFYNCDVDDNMELASKFGIQNVPALVVLKKGAIADTKVGFMPEPILEQWLNGLV